MFNDYYTAYAYKHDNVPIWLIGTVISISLVVLPVHKILQNPHHFTDIFIPSSQEMMNWFHYSVWKDSDWWQFFPFEQQTVFPKFDNRRQSSQSGNISWTNVSLLAKMSLCHRTVHNWNFSTNSSCLVVSVWQLCWFKCSMSGNKSRLFHGRAIFGWNISVFNSRGH